MNNINFDKIKLIIWDLDETLWKGTLSEGGISTCDNIPLIHILADHGIINAICSKNDKDSAEHILKQLNILDLFVFNSIDWTPKGPRIEHMIKDMGLRATNVLFIDDNIVNLNEAIHYSPDLMVSTPDIIPQLSSYYNSRPITDNNHSRLNQYKILQKKKESRKTFTDNTAFLFSTNTKVEIHKDCLNEIDRIHELILRTNQLNYTKNRCTKDELNSLLKDKSVKSGYITAKDKFGDYGIVGFYALKGKKLIHFLFSCRTIGQGIEQYVYSTLKWPELNVVGTVINYVQHIPAPEWINQNQDLSINSEEKISAKIVMKGPCDMSILASYLNSNNIITEFTYIGEKRHNSIEHHNHSINFLQFPFLTTKEQNQLLSDCIFNDEAMFKTAMYDNDTLLIFLSTQIEPNLGIYKNKISGKEIAFAEFCYPLTDKVNWPLYTNKIIPTYDNDFTTEWLESFSEKYEFIGQITPEQYIENIKVLLSKINPSATICLLLGSEIPYVANTQKAYENREIYYSALNAKLRKFAHEEKRILLISFNDYIHSQDDFLDNINHYKRHVYFEAAKQANIYISNIIGYKTKTKSRFYLLIDEIGAKIINNNLRNTKLYRLIKCIYDKIKK